MKQLMDETYRQFVAKAAQGRKMPIDQAGEAGRRPGLHRPAGQGSSAWSTRSARSTTRSPPRKALAGMPDDPRRPSC